LFVSVLQWHLWPHSQADATAAEWWRGEGKQPAFSFCCRGLSQPSACKHGSPFCLLLERSSPCSPSKSCTLSAVLSTSLSPPNKGLRLTLGDRRGVPSRTPSILCQ